MVSSKDVAKKAKVSQATVSRVLNSPHLVKAETRQKILQAIEELNWKPKFNSLETIIETAWNWHKNHPNGYEK